MQTEPERSRAIFSTQDFRLLRAAVVEYAKTCENPDDAAKCANLLHRLGRVG